MVITAIAVTIIIMNGAAVVSGDLVVDLAGLLRMSAIYAGAISAVISLSILNQRTAWKILGFILGGIAGLLLGSFLGPILFPASVDYVMVVKLGPGAFLTSLKAALAGAITSSIIVSVLTSSIFRQVPSRRTRVVATCIMVGLAIGAFCAFMATRP